LEFKLQHQRRLNNLAVLEPDIGTCFTTGLSIAPHASDMTDAALTILMLDGGIL
jgi:hypothetical protein